MDSATVGLGDPYGGMDSVIGLSCSPTCAKADWQPNHVIAFMPASYAPPDAKPSAGHCGNCHVASFSYSEPYLLPQLFYPIHFGNVGAATCSFTGIDLNPWPASLLKADGTGNGIDRASSLIAPSDTSISWMTEPHGGQWGSEGNMPYDVHCKSDDLESNANDMIKSEIRRWILRGAP